MSRTAAVDDLWFEIPFATLFEDLVRFCQRKLKGRPTGLAEDIAQETMILLWTLQERGFEVKKPLAFARHKAWHVLKNRCRREDRQRAHEVAVDSLRDFFISYAGDAGEISFERFCSEYFAESLSDRQIKVLAGRLQGLTLAEIAELLEVSIGTVHGDLSRALKLTRSVLGTDSNIWEVIAVLCRTAWHRLKRELRILLRFG